MATSERHIPRLRPLVALVVVGLLVMPPSSNAVPVTPEGEPLYAPGSGAQLTYAPVYTGTTAAVPFTAVRQAQDVPTGAAVRTSDPADGAGLPTAPLAACALGLAIVAGAAVAASRLRRNSNRTGPKEATDART